jgi:hypothetical protein
MYVFELKQNHYLQKCGHVGVFYTKTHKYKIRYKVENFEACYITEKGKVAKKAYKKRVWSVEVMRCKKRKKSDSVYISKGLI